MSEPTKNDLLWAQVEGALRRMGIDPAQLADGEVRCVVVSPKLQDCVHEVAQSHRGQVVMVRVDDATSAKLDAWVETGAVGMPAL